MIRLKILFLSISKFYIIIVVVFFIVMVKNIKKYGSSNNIGKYCLINLSSVRFYIKGYAFDLDQYLVSQVESYPSTASCMV